MLTASSMNARRINSVFATTCICNIYLFLFDEFIPTFAHPCTYINMCTDIHNIKT